MSRTFTKWAVAKFGKAQAKITKALRADQSKLIDALMQSELAVSVAGLGVSRYDAITDELILDERARQIYGTDLVDCIMTVSRFKDLVHPEDWPRVVSALRRQEDENKSRTTTDFRITLPSGRIRHIRAITHASFNSRGELLARLSVSSDITEYVVTAAELHKEKVALTGALVRARLATEIAGLGVCETDLKSHQEKWDARFCEVLGEDRGPMGGEFHSWVELVHSEDRERVAETLQLARSSRVPVEIMFRVQTKHGHVRNLKLASKSIFDAEEGVLKAYDVISDKTEQLRLQNAAERERYLLDATLSAISDGVIRVNELGEIEYMNRAAREMSESTSGREEVLRFHSAFSLLNVNDKPLRLRNEDGFPLSVISMPAKLVFKRRAPRDVEISIRSVDRPEGEPGAQVVVLHDLTDLKQSQAALADSEERFHRVLDHAPIGLMVIDDQARISFANKAISEVTGQSLADMLGKQELGVSPLRDLMPNELIEFRRGRGYDVDDLHYELTLDHGERKGSRLRICIRTVHHEDDAVHYYIVRVEDVTAEYRYIEQIHQANELAHVTISSAIEGIVCTDESGIVKLCNPVALRMIGGDEASTIGQKFVDLFRFINTRDGRDMSTRIDSVIAGGKSVRLNAALALMAADGDPQRVNLSIAPMQGASGDLVGAVALIQDASEIATLTDRLVHQAYTDELTGCPNRRAFEERLGERMEGLEVRSPKDFLLFLDLDHFKVINDLCGHGAGDDVLCDVVRILRQHVRECDFVARLGGDEFGIILCGADKQVACRVAQSIVADMEDYRLNYNDRMFRIGVSIGMVELSDQVDIEAAMTQADVACYSAKNSGRGRFCSFEDAAEEIFETQQNRSWYHRLLEAIEEDRIVLFLQQIVSKDGNCCGYEALMRLREGGALFSPEAFLDNARRSGIVPKLDRVMFQHVVDFIRSEPEDTVLERKPYFSVNLSASSIADVSFRNWLENKLDENIDLVDRIWFELTETERMRWTDQEKEFLGSLRRRGARLFLDDFGTGYNSFEVLKMVELDGLKLDYSVIRDVTTCPIGQSLVGAALGICRHLGLEIVAEGVENEMTAKFLASLGVNKFQGYYFNRPTEAKTMKVRTSDMRGSLAGA